MNLSRDSAIRIIVASALPPHLPTPSPSLVRHHVVSVIGKPPIYASIYERPVKQVEAVRHEDTRGHVNRVRHLDREPAPISSPLRATSETECESGRGRSPSGSRSPPIRDPVDEFPDLFGGRPSLHGPVPPSDNLNQIYDDFSGELARIGHPQSLPTSLPATRRGMMIILIPPEIHLVVELSHGNCQNRMDFFNEYDSQFANEQRCKFNMFILHISSRFLAQFMPHLPHWKLLEMTTGGVGVECLLDLMSDFPKNGVSDQPTIKQVENHRQGILNVAGLETKIFEGKLGNLFAVNDWLKILKHEFANSLIRLKLHLYLEDSGERLEEARQAAKRKEEVDGNISRPMARGNGEKDYYVEEVCFARLDSQASSGPVMPMRWFTRDGEILSIAHPLHLTPSKSAFVIDGSEGAFLEIPLANYFLNVRDLEEPDCQARYGIPPPSSIAGIQLHSSPVSALVIDTLEYRVILNFPWRNGTSLLLMNGASRAMDAEFIQPHFGPTAMIHLATEAQKDGIEVWDCEYKEWILIIPWFLAFQGDNPMSSEFASHIGMKGKYFCRAGAPGTKEQTIVDLIAQLKRAVDGAPSAVDDMATDTGSKDKYFQHFFSTNFNPRPQN
ncbi:hypothetical protein B0H13DRAFT_1918803 [Mycena leptocephala]|nr:hypothetical protein B0H13DRAFT_1918803 [Mycena leptocephala]